MNKKISAVLSIFLSIIVLCTAGCANTRPRSVSGRISVPENGIIEKEVFEQLISDNSIAVFTGEYNGINYEWTVFGSDIPEPKDLNLLIVFDEDNDKQTLGFKLASTESFGFSASLSVYCNEIWNAESASVYSEKRRKYFTGLQRFNNG